ncbi:hypothetical protein RKD32_003958 [Streptomyces sp. SAI-195]|uniref:hypothetical protein n=1 Tax=Streptomyces sp. SAI-195 TaxID=3377734 RepID=UPI003C7CA62D
MLPDGIPTVTVTGRYLSLNDEGQPLSGQVIFRAPGLITFPDYDVILGGPVSVPLDATGAFEVELPATDAPGMNPSGWSYSVAEQLAGVPLNRVYNVLLPAETPAVDIADIAPTDPTTPTYVAVRGDSAYEVAVKAGFVGTVEQWLASLIGEQGPQGATGVRGSQVYTGTTAPAASLGVDGDVYMQYTTATNLGVTNTVVNLWSKSGGAWARVGGDVKGAAWYVASGPGTPSATVPVGDMLLRTDVGTVYQRGASGWESKGSIMGPQGPQGVQGVQGDQGAPGVVQSVNGKSAAAVDLTAADVGALARSGTTTGVAATLTGSGSADPLTINGGPSTTDRFVVRADGSVYSNSLLNTLYNVGIGPGSTPFGGGRYVLGMQNASTEPTGTPASGLVAYASAGKLKILQGDGSTITVGDAQPTAPPPGVWLPQDFGLSGWAYDLHANSPTPGDMPSQAGRLYLVGVPLRTAKTVTQIAVHVMGYDKPNSTLTGAYFGIYNSAFVPLSRSADARSQLPEVHNVGGQIAKITVPSVSLAAGFYYVAILVKGPTTASPFFGATNWTPVGTATKETTSGAVGASTSGVHRWLQTSSTSLTSLPAAGGLTAASFAEATTCYWAAIV